MAGFLVKTASSVVRLDLTCSGRFLYPFAALDGTCRITQRKERRDQLNKQIFLSVRVELWFWLGLAMGGFCAKWRWVSRKELDGAISLTGS